VEDGPAMELASRHRSLYRVLLEAEEIIRTEMWASIEWRRLRLDGGRLIEEETTTASRPASHQLSLTPTNGHHSKLGQAGGLPDIC
jgi:hypothetical protein